jgi:hypothetical protein
MWPWLQKALGALPAQAKAQLLPHLLKASAQLLPLWSKLKARGAELGSLATAAPEVLAPTARALYARLQDDPEAIARAIGPFWDAAQRLLNHPEVRAHLHHLALHTLDIASDQLEAALRWIDSPDSTRKLGEGLTALERFIGAWLAAASPNPEAPPEASPSASPPPDQGPSA